MLLTIDVGNSNIVTGIFLESKLIKQSRRLTSQHSYILETLSDEIEENIDSIIIASVVPKVTTQLKAQLAERFRLEPFVVHPNIKRTGITFGSVNPKELGADLFANAVAIYNLFGRDCLSVDLGTASKFCVVSENGLYKGTTIVPGMEVSFDALLEKAALLPQINLAPTDTIINTDTIACLQSGIFHGYCALVDGLIDKIKNEQGDLYVTLTGGLGSLLYKHLHNIDEYVPNLTLQGLRIIAEMNVCPRVKNK